MDPNTQKKTPLRNLVPPRKSFHFVPSSINLYAFDFETFIDPNRRATNSFVVYSAAIGHVPSITSVPHHATEQEALKHVECAKYLGVDGFDNFMLKVSHLPDHSFLIAYNGSRFDFFFIFNWCIEHKVIIHRVLRQNSSKIIYMEFGSNKIKLWDLCLFTCFSLSKVCETLKVPKQFCKTGFDHNKIKTWEDVNTHAKEIVSYNSMDVVSLAFCFQTFAENIKTEFNFNILNTYTISHLAYEIWRQHFLTKDQLENISLPNTVEDYQWIRRAVFGGRVQPQRRGFISQNYSWICHGPPDVVSNEIDKVDTRTMLDVVSLYPTACCRYSFPMGNYTIYDYNDPSHTEKLSELVKIIHKQQLELNIDHRGQHPIVEYLEKCIMEVDIICPKDLLIPFLFSRDKKGVMSQDLLPKYNQVYDGHTIVEALKLGYQIIHIHKTMEFEYTDNPFYRYMDKCFKGKLGEAAGSVLYFLYKLLMNGLTGKMSQKFINEEWKIIYGDHEVRDANYRKNIKSFEIIKHSRTGRPVAICLNVLKPEALPTKPIQLGAFLLGASRVHMSKMYKALNAYYSPSCTIDYGDTDSLIVSTNAYIVALEQHPTMFGPQMGQLSDDLAGGKIIRGFYISPKVYFLEYYRGGKLFWKIRAKGVPKGNLQTSVDKIKEDTRNFDEIMAWHIQDPLQRPIFQYQVAGQTYCSPTLTDHIFVVLYEGGTFQVTYACMKKNIMKNQSNHQAADIKFIVTHRDINKKPWWNTGVRSLPPYINQVSYPKGHVLYYYSNDEDGEK